MQIKCKTCGGSEFIQKNNREVCRYCGATYVVYDPGLEAELRMAESFRESAQFDLAAGLYHKIIKTYTRHDLSDAYWGLFLCEQRVMFETNENGERFPSFYTITSNAPASSAFYADAVSTAEKYAPQRAAIFKDLTVKMQRAKQLYARIEQTSRPYDLFICFKKSKTDGSGDTKDCALAIDLYNHFAKDYNIFFSERSLKNVVVREFEPNIYYGLYTAKVMLLLCSKKEYIESQWVKNEWSRYAAFAQNPAAGKTIIPIFLEDFSPHSLPGELMSYQGLPADYHLFGDLEKTLKNIIHPVDMEAELNRRMQELMAEQQRQFQEQLDKLRQQNQSTPTTVSTPAPAPTPTPTPASAPAPTSSPVAAPMSTATPPPAAAEPVARTDTPALVAPKKEPDAHQYEATPPKAEAEKPKAAATVAQPASVTPKPASTVPTAPAASQAECEQAIKALRARLIGIQQLMQDAEKEQPAEKLQPQPIQEAKEEQLAEASQPIVIPDFVIENGVLKKYRGKGGDITIPDGVKSIGSDAFLRCSDLTSVTIPSSITSIDDFAFYQRISLTSVIFGENSQLTNIGASAFDGCSSLTSITIPSSVTTIGASAFDNCKRLNGVYITDLAAWCNISFANPSANPLSGNLYLNGSKISGDVVIPEGATAIPTNAFYYCDQITSITIPSTVTSIAASAFSCCTSLTSITIPFSVTSIGVYAFYSCGLTSITIPSSVTSIDNLAFYCCSRLTSITIPSSVTFIGRSAFNECRSLESVIFKAPDGWEKTEGAFRKIKHLEDPKAAAKQLKDQNCAWKRVK